MKKAFSFLAIVAACGGSTGVDLGGADGGTGAGGSGAGVPSPSGCPATAPAYNTACPKENLVCSYGDAWQPYCREIFICVQSAWSKQQGTCEEHSQTDCPASPPEHGSVCSPTPVSTYCEYAGQGASCHCLDTYCVGACQIIDPPEWRCVTPPNNEGCPSTTPNAGAACSAEGVECNYLGGPCAGGGVLARCSAGAWEWASNGPCPA